MTAEQLEELAGGANPAFMGFDYDEVITELARKVIAAEAMAKALEDLIDYCGSSQMGCSTWDEEAALTAYREASK